METDENSKTEVTQYMSFYESGIKKKLPVHYEKYIQVNGDYVGK